MPLHFPPIHLPSTVSDFIYWISMVAVAVSAISGTLESGERRMDAVGVTVVGLATALGGGTMRDLLLNRPVFWVIHPAYLYSAFLGVLLTFVLARLVYLPVKLFVIPDAIGLALFTVVGAQVALDMHYSWLVAVMMGVVTAVFGGVMRDIFCNTLPLIFMPGFLYAAASFSGALGFIGLQALGVEHVAAGWFGMGLTFVLRLLGMYLKVGVPAFKKRD
jgi:uncharacterized membrane protein YeiH